MSESCEFRDDDSQRPQLAVVPEVTRWVVIERKMVSTTAYRIWDVLQGQYLRDPISGEGVVTTSREDAEALVRALVMKDRLEVVRALGGP